MLNIDQFYYTNKDIAKYVYSDSDGLLTLNSHAKDGSDNEKVGFLTSTDVSFSNNQILDIQISMQIIGPVCVSEQPISDKETEPFDKKTSKKKIKEKSCKPYVFLDLDD